MNPKKMLLAVAAIAASLPAWGVLARAQAVKTSGVYRTADDYAVGRMAFEGECGSKAHKLAIHDVSNKPYIDVTQNAEKHRYAKSELYGFRACDGRDFRFAGKLEYQILEAKELYIYERDSSVSQGRTYRTVREYYFGVGASGAIQSLTRENLKEAFPENHRFHDLLDATFGGGENIAEYDDFHKMFKVNRLLIASRG